MCRRQRLIESTWPSGALQYKVDFEDRLCPKCQPPKDMTIDDIVAKALAAVQKAKSNPIEKDRGGK